MAKAAAPTRPQKFEQLEDTLNGELLERTKEVHTALVALVSRRHHVQIGPPGCAKTLLVRRIVDRIADLDYVYVHLGVERRVAVTLDAQGNEVNRELVQVPTKQELHQPGYFQWLMTRYSVPEELFGPADLAALQEGRYERNVSGKLPMARIAFLDEIWKGNSSILNALLTILNERQFFNNGYDSNVPLACMFGASNEMPQGDELWALWDRMHFRHEIRPLQDGGSFMSMLSTPMVANPDPILTWDDIVSAQEEAAQVTIPTDIFEALMSLRDTLNKESIEPTERRFVESLNIIRAEAWLAGRDVAEIEDMRSLRHVLWTHLEGNQQRIVEKAVLELANPIDREATDLLERVESLEGELKKVIKEADNPKAVAKQAVEIYGKLHKTKARMDELKERCAENGRKSDVLETLDKRFHATAKQLMEKGFGVQAP